MNHIVQEAIHNRKLWVDQAKRVRKIKDLETEHLRAIVRCIKRGAALYGQAWKRDYIRDEIKKRYVI